MGTFYIAYIVLIILCISPILSKNACIKTFEGNRCLRLQNKTCFTSDLTYSFTTSILVSGHSDSNKDLKLWENLKHVPKCWDAIRPVLCAVYLPRCDYDGTINKSLVQLPKKKMCDFMKGPCKIVEELNLWPIYLNCNYYYYSEGCHDNAADLKFSHTGSCKHPLIKTNNTLSWYPGFEDCTFSCQNPWFTDEEHAKVHFTILIFCLCCIACNLFAVLTFGCNWKHLSNFPDIIILYMNVCFMVSSLGWLFQFIPNVRNNVVCKLDGTPKRAESQFKSDESPLCIIVFIIIYFFTLASVAWLVVLTYTWQVAFETSRGQVKKKKAYFHMGVWVLSIVLTVLCLAFAEIDGNTLTGICFIGSENYHSRGVFILMPMVVSWIAGVAFLVRGMLLLINMKSQSPDLLSMHKIMKLKSSIVRIGFFLSTLILFGIIAFGLNIYVFVNMNTWKTSMRNYVICTSNLTGEAGVGSDCSIRNKPSISSIQLSLFCYFGFGVLLSSWLWKMAAFKSWKYCLTSYLHPCCNSSDHHGTVGLMELEKNNLNTISETEDLIGMDFDLNSMTSFDVSSLSSILTCNRRHSDSDVSTIEEKLFKSTKKCILKETCIKSNGASSLSSSEWSGSESQNSHFSIYSPIYQHFKKSETDSIGMNAYNTFIVESSNLEKSDLFFNKRQFIKNIRKSAIGNISTTLKSLIKDVAMQKGLAYFALDLHFFNAQTRTMYENVEENVLCSKSIEDISDYDYYVGGDECETIDSSNSNYTLASSDTEILSINVDCDYRPIALSIDSLINETSEKVHATEFLDESNKDVLPSYANHMYCSYYPTRAFQMRGSCRPHDTSYPISNTSNRIKTNDDIVCQIHPDDTLSDECSIGNMSIISIDQEFNDGDESGNVSDLAQSFKKDPSQISIIRRKRFFTLNRNEEQLQSLNFCRLKTSF